MSEYCPFVPLTKEYRELLENGTKPAAGGSIHLLDLDLLDKQQKQAPRVLGPQQKDIIRSAPLEIAALIAAYLDPNDLVSSRRVKDRVFRAKIGFRTHS